MLPLASVIVLISFPLLWQIIWEKQLKSRKYYFASWLQFMITPLLRAWGEVEYHGRENIGEKTVYLMAARKKREAGSFQGEDIFPKGILPRTHSLQLSPSSKFSIISQLPIKLWTHQWISLLMTSVPSWSNHLPKTCQLAVMAKAYGLGRTF